MYKRQVLDQAVDSALNGLNLSNVPGIVVTILGDCYVIALGNILIDVVAVKVNGVGVAEDGLVAAAGSANRDGRRSNAVDLGNRCV